MFDRDIWIEILSSMVSNPLRTLLTSISVSVGIFILIVLLGMGKGLETGAKSNIMDDASNSIWVRSGRTSLPYNGYQPNREIEFQEANRQYVMDEIDGVEIASARLGLWNTEMTYKDKKLFFGLRCVHPNYRDIELVTLTEGRFINEGDIDGIKKVAVIGSVVKDDLFEDEDPIGKMMLMNGINFMVVGIFDEPNGRWENRQVYIPINTGQKLFGQNRDAFGMIALKTDFVDLQTQGHIANKIDHYIRGVHSIHPDDRKALRVIDMSANYASFDAVTNGISVFVSVIGILTLMIGIIGVSNIMTIVVKERTKEIGVRKALGARPRSIVLMIVQEAVLLTLVSGLIGFILGYGLLNLLSGVIEHEFFKNPQVSFGKSIAAIIVLVVAGTISGLIPAINAARIKPVEALKDE